MSTGASLLEIPPNSSRARKASELPWPASAAQLHQPRCFALGVICAHTALAAAVMGLVLRSFCSWLSSSTVWFSHHSALPSLAFQKPLPSTSHVLPLRPRSDIPWGPSTQGMLPAPPAPRAHCAGWASSSHVFVPLGCVLLEGEAPCLSLCPQRVKRVNEPKLR